MVNLVSGGKELETESHLHKAEHDLHGVQPSSALRQVLQQAREHREEHERQGEGQRERQHGHNRSPELALSGIDEHGTHDRAGATEGNEHEGEGEEEHSPEALALVNLSVAGVRQLGRKHNLEGSEEGSCEDHEHQEEDDVREPMRCKPVEYVCRHRVASDQACNQNQYGNRHGVQQNDENAVHQGAEAVLRRLVVPLHEEAYRHRDDREYARRQQSREAPENRSENHTPQRA